MSDQQWGQNGLPNHTYQPQQFDASDQSTRPLGNYQQVQNHQSPYQMPQTQQAQAYPGYIQVDAPVQAAKPEKSGHGKTVLAAALLAALVGGGVGAGATLLATQGVKSVATTVSGATIVSNADQVNGLTAAVAKAMPSTVTLAVMASRDSGSGSGIVLDDQGHILTNTHVVTLDGAVADPDIEVQFSDGIVRKAEIVGTDPASDLAVIKVDPAGLTLTPATLGDSSQLNVGDTTIAIGAPLGLENTVTDGIVSTLSRTIEVASSAAPEEGGDSSSESESDSLNQSPFQFEIPGQRNSTNASSTIALNVIQTDAAINPGNSGGALLNAQGDVIGVNVAIASVGANGSIGVGFAIPINYAQRVAQELIADGSASHGLLGANISNSPADDDSSEAFADGALIQRIVSGSGADQAGLKKGDVVVRFDGRRIGSAIELTATVRQTAAGSTVDVVYVRDGQEQTAQVTLGDSQDS